MDEDARENELLIGISPITILGGNAPTRVRSMVLEWAALHQNELLKDWERCRSAQVPLPIPPLE